MVIESNELNLLWLQDGEDGTPGTPGKDGQVLYTWMKYSHNADGSDMSDDSTNMEYVGIAYNKTSKTESTNPSDYTWSKIKGDPGNPGTDAYTIILENENISFATSSLKVPLNNQTATCRITVLQGAKPRTDYIIGTITSPTGITVKESNKVITLSVNTNTAIENLSGAIDVPIQIDGISFTKKITYSLAVKGETGDSPVSVYLSNENHTFAATKDGHAFNAQIQTNVYAYYGSTQVSATVGDITSPLGMTIEILNNGKSNTILAISVTSDLNENGVVDIPVTVGNNEYHCTFSYTLSRQGADGSPAKSIDITSSSQIFKSTDGGVTFAPDIITLTPRFQGGITYSKWKYSVNGGKTWDDITSTTNGISITSGVLSISKSSTLYTKTITSIVFKCLSSDSSFYDTCTISKLYDVVDIRDDIEAEFTQVKSSISGVEQKADKANKSITDKVWQTDITDTLNNYDKSTVKDVRDRVSNVETNLEGITSTVQDMQTTVSNKADGSTVTELTNRVAKAEQNAEGFKQTVESTYAKQTDLDNVNKYAKTSFEQLSDKFTWIVTSTSTSSSLTLTDSVISAITKQFVIKDSSGKATIIEGGKIKTDALKSNNYIAGTYVDGAGYSSLGTFIDLENGMIHTPGFYTDTIGNAYLAGTVHASAGWFGTEEHNWFLGATTITNIMNDSGALIDSDYSYLKATDNAAIVAGDWYLMAQNSDIGLRSGLSTLNGGNFVKNPVDGKYYDFGIVEPDMTSDAKDYNKSFLYIRRAQTKQTHPQDWEYLFRVDYEGKIWYKGNLIAGEGGMFLSTTGGTITGNLTVNGKLTATASSADKLLRALTINGKSFTGSSAVDVGTIGIAYGGTGATSASGARTNLGVMGAVNGNGYYGLTRPDGNDSDWIRTTSNGIIPYKSGSYSSLGTSSWRFSKAYIDTIYGSLSGTATKAMQDGSGNVIADTYLRKDFDTVGQNVIFSSSVDIDDLTAGTLLVNGNARFINGLKGELTGNVNGTASYAEKMKTARKIGNASFDGSKDISLNDIGASASGHTHNYASKIQFAGTDYNSVSNVVTITKENLQSALGTTGLGLITEKERSKLGSIKVSSGGTIDFSGVTASGALTAKTNDDKTVLITHNKSGVSSGTYKSVTVDDYGHVTSGSNPTTLGGYGITDALSSSTKYALGDSVGGNALKANLLANILGRPTSANIDITGSGGLSTFKATSTMTTGKPMTDGHILHFYWDNVGGWDSQLFVSGYSDIHAQIRGQSNGTWGNWRTLLDDNNFSDYAASKSHNHDDTYLKLSGGTMTGTITHEENIVVHNYRPYDSDYTCGLMYQTAGNEALVYAAKNKVTSFMFLNGADPSTMTSTTWESSNPALQIKKNSVYVNELIPNGTTPSYTFSVKGNSNLNGEVIIGNGCTLKYDQDADCLDFIFN